MAMANCSVCRNTEKKGTVDAALVSGLRPIDVFRQHGEALSLSQSSIYRHARRHAPRSALSLEWLGGDTTTGDVISDLAALRRGLLEGYREATERGDRTNSVRLAHEAQAVSATLLKEHVTTDGRAEVILEHGQMVRAIQKAARDRPEFAVELADAARSINLNSLATDADNLATYAFDYRDRMAATTTKETA